ncbi:MAG: toxin-antitoxin system HicB family antitoxin [Leptolyngbya sp. ERB_1_1]
MSRLTVRLPETLHQQLIRLAEGEGVSLNQYIVYALTRQVTLTDSIHAFSQAEIQQQPQELKALTRKLGQASSTEIQSILAERDRVEPEAELTSEVIDRLRERIRDQR